MNQQRLDEIKTRLNNIQADAWLYTAGTLKHYVDLADYRISLQEFHYLDGHETNAAHDARFIAAAPVDVRDLIAEVERLRALLAEIEQLPFVTEQDGSSYSNGIYRVMTMAHDIARKAVEDQP